MKTRAHILLATGVLALAGCGGGDTEPAATEAARGAVAQPEPVEPISAMVEPLNAAIEAESCRQYVALVTSLAREGEEPGAPPQRGECAVFERGPLRVLEGARFDESAEYGTGAVIEGTIDDADGTRSVVTLWIVDRDGRFRVSYAADGVSQLGTEPDPEARPEEAATEFVDAIRAGDCDALKPVLNPDGRLVQSTGGPDAACETVIGGALFAPALDATPDAEAVELGATGNYAFYGVATSVAYFTLVLSNLPDREGPMTVLDVLPSTPIELPDGAPPDRG